MSALTDRIYRDWCGKNHPGEMRGRLPALERARWLADALEVGHRWRTARQRQRFGVDAQHSMAPQQGQEQPCGSTHALPGQLPRGAAINSTGRQLRAPKTELI